MASEQSTRPSPATGANRGFLARITAATALGEGLDGYDLGTISVVLVTIESAFHLDSVQEGLLGASSLIGIFAGGLVFGWISDRFGRRNLFVFDLVAFVAIGALQMVAHSFLVLFALRICLGLAIGAEYAIGETMLAEMVPSHGRGWRLSSLQATWYGGYLMAVIVAYVLKGLGVDWRFILATGVIPATVTLILRQGLPESPRWLASVGRVTEAKTIVDRYLGDQYYAEENLDAEPEAAQATLGPAALFGPENWRRTLFGSLFFTCVVTPYFAIATFAPTVFSSLGFHDPKVNVIAVNATAFLGAIAGMFLIERLGRRPLLIWSFWAMLLTIGVAGAWVAGPSTLIIVCLLAFAFSNAIGGDLCGVYPAELFPSDLRASGVGFAAAMSRIGAAGGTFLLPIFINDFGIGTSLLISAGVCLLGLVVSYWLAPETTGRSLGDVGHAIRPAVAAAPAAG